MTASTSSRGEVAVVMADQIIIQDGALPWEPSGGSELIETYDYYDQPILGLIRQAGHPYVFRCVDLIDPYSVWAYALLEEKEVERLCEVEDQDLPETLREVTAGKPFTIALAKEQSGIFEWLFLDGSEDSPDILDSQAIRLAFVPKLTELTNRLSEVTDHVVDELAH
jgi:hypothetical protein